ncbi:hypothetical protein GIB67_027698 [Kingdonia uniflora]|uniref:Uncharacterized protein n=1 Tax=Kingdonia uniflora TaxID=39325 RepID=A0A7J7NLN8_9MAGN|nr:hypothetical protein GIB67_027698 [Kingdonia uniflora]
MPVDATGLKLVRNLGHPGTFIGLNGGESSKIYQHLTHRAPPVLIPYDTDLGCPHTPPDQESCCNKVDESIAESIESTQAVGQTNTNEGMKESPNCKSVLNSLHSSPKEFEDEPSKLSKSIDLAIEEEDCSICLEEYDVENPKIITK